MEAVVGARGVYPSGQTVLRWMQSVKVELGGGASAICVLQMILSLMNLFKSFIYRLKLIYTDSVTVLTVSLSCSAQHSGSFVVSTLNSGGHSSAP